MRLKTLTLTLESNREIRESAAKLRGFFATKFNEYVLLHQHKDDKFVYRYPLIQYKMIDKKPIIIGINEGSEVLKEIYNKSEYLKLGNSKYKLFGMELKFREQEFGISKSPINYRFLTPWFALNQDNFKEFVKLTFKEQQDKLRRLLAANLLSMSKTLGYTVKEDIIVKTKLRKTRSSLKRTKIMAFKGEFQVNFNIPDLLGIGKSVSRGFGTTMKIP